MRPGEPDLLEYGGFQEGDLVIDVGGGRGGAVADGPERGLRAVVVDRSVKALAEVPAGLPRVRADAGHLPVLHGVADGVLLRAVMHHFLEPARVIKEAARISRPGASLVIVDRVSPEDGAAQALRNAVDRLRDAHHVWTWTMNELSNLGGAARWEEEERLSWVEEKDLETWMERTAAKPACAAWVREMVERDRVQGGIAFGATETDGRVVVRETWCALRLRKRAGGR
ncbi:MAG: class I SAM-dependent methyltransferase [Planctomycetota bacterium]